MPDPSFIRRSSYSYRMLFSTGRSICFAIKIGVSAATASVARFQHDVDFEAERIEQFEDDWKSRSLNAAHHQHRHAAFVFRIVVNVVTKALRRHDL